MKEYEDNLQNNILTTCQDYEINFQKLADRAYVLHVMTQCKFNIFTVFSPAVLVFFSPAER